MIALALGRRHMTSRYIRLGGITASRLRDRVSLRADSIDGATQYDKSTYQRRTLSARIGAPGHKGRDAFFVTNGRAAVPLADSGAWYLAE